MEAGAAIFVGRGAAAWGTMPLSWTQATQRARGVFLFFVLGIQRCLGQIEIRYVRYGFASRCFVPLSFGGYPLAFNGISITLKE